MSHPLSIFMLAGEASGDLLGAQIIKALKKQVPNIHIEGVAGPEMVQAGCSKLFPMDPLSVMGFIEPLKSLPQLLKLRKKILNHILTTKPDVFVGIDAPDFNLGLEVLLKKKGIPVVHCVSPSVWAWRRWRIKKIKRAVDIMLTLLPFEEDFYKEYNVPAKFIGHPLADEIPMQCDKNAARKALGLPLNKKILAIMPGSRSMELRNMTSVFIRAAQMCYSCDGAIEVITAMHDKKREKQFKKILQKIGIEFRIKIFTKNSQQVMQAADVLLLTSGTVTLEAMLLKKPMVVAYKMATINLLLAKLLVKVKFFSLPNLIAQKKLVPEFLQSDATPKNLSKAVLEYFNDHKKAENIQEEFTKLHQQLKCDASRQAADAILSNPKIINSM